MSYPSRRHRQALPDSHGLSCHYPNLAFQPLVQFYRVVWLIVTRRVRHLGGCLIVYEFEGMQRRGESQSQYSQCCSCRNPQAAHRHALRILRPGGTARALLCLPPTPQMNPRGMFQCARCAYAPFGNAVRTHRGRPDHAICRTRCVRLFQIAPQAPAPGGQTICFHIRDALGILRYLTARYRAEWSHLIF